MRHLTTALVLVVLCASPAWAQDWPQWRGPGQDGIAPPGPTLAESWGPAGPAKVWESNAVPSYDMGGFSSVSVVGNKAYVFVNWKTLEPLATRTIGAEQLKALGLFKEQVPTEMLAKIEADRVSEARLALKDNEVKAWVDKWVAENLDPNDKKAFGRVAVERLTRGKTAMSMEALAKLTTIVDKPFGSAAQLDSWLTENEITGEAAKSVQQVVPKTKPAVAKDVILCLNVADGKELWRREYPGQPYGWGSSSTPCVQGGRCYVAGGKTIYCLDAADGNEIWKTPAKGGEISSSPTVVDGVVVVLGGSLTGLSAADGKELWNDKAVPGTNPSPIVWASGGQRYVLCNSSKGVACVEPVTGNVLWTAPGGGSGTVAASGDVCVIFSDNKDIGLVAYRISPQTVDKMWSVPLGDRGTTPIIYDGHVYVVGKDKAMCVNLDDGKVCWEEKVPCEIRSPVLADGKIISQVESTKVMMFAANPEKFQKLGYAAMGGAQCSSPSIAGGKLFLRLVNSIACYDLTAAATSEPAK